MNIFLDVKNTNRRQDTKPISLCLVSDKDDVFYAEFSDFQRSYVSSYRLNNLVNDLFFKDDMSVIPKVSSLSSKRFFMKGSTENVKHHLSRWLFQFKEEIDIWSFDIAYKIVTYENVLGGIYADENRNYFDLKTLLKKFNIDIGVNLYNMCHNYINFKNHGDNSLSNAKLYRATFLFLKNLLPLPMYKNYFIDCFFGDIYYISKKIVRLKYGPSSVNSCHLSALLGHWNWDFLVLNPKKEIVFSFISDKAKKFLKKNNVENKWLLKDIDDAPALDSDLGLCYYDNYRAFLEEFLLSDCGENIRHDIEKKLKVALSGFGRRFYGRQCKED